MCRVETRAELLQRKCEEHVKDIELLKASLQRLEEENKFLKDDVEKKTLSIQNLKGDDLRTKFYTGFPNFETLSAVFSVTSKKVKSRRTKLPKEDERTVADPSKTWEESCNDGLGLQI